MNDKMIYGISRILIAFSLMMKVIVGVLWPESITLASVQNSIILTGFLIVINNWLKDA
jgi:hypothetical protein